MKYEDDEGGKVFRKRFDMKNGRFYIDGNEVDKKRFEEEFEPVMNKFLRLFKGLSNDFPADRLNDLLSFSEKELSDLPRVSGHNMVFPEDAFKDMLNRLNSFLNYNRVRRDRFPDFIKFINYDGRSGRGIEDFISIFNDKLVLTDEIKEPRDYKTKNSPLFVTHNEFNEYDDFYEIIFQLSNRFGKFNEEGIKVKYDDDGKKLKINFRDDFPRYDFNLSKKIECDAELIERVYNNNVLSIKLKKK